MLVLFRHEGESIVIADDIIVTVLRRKGDGVVLGITAPKDIDVHRQEIYEQLHGAVVPGPGGDNNGGKR